MILGIDHLVIAVVDPDAAISELAAFLELSPGLSGGRHTAWGTRNRLLWLGDTYVELCTVADPRLAERSWLGRATLRALPTAPKAIGWAISTDDLDLDRAQMNADGATLGPATPGERRRPDGQVVRWRQALPPEIGLERPFLIEHDLSAPEWTPDDRAARAASPARLRELELPVDAIYGLRFDTIQWPPARGSITLANQIVRTADSSVVEPTVRIGGLGRGDVAAALVGCRWLVD